MVTKKSPTDPEGTAAVRLRPPVFIGSAEVCRRSGLSRSTIWRRMRDGSFPQSVRISKGRVAWIEAEIDAWCKERIKSARGGVWSEPTP